MMTTPRVGASQSARVFKPTEDQLQKAYSSACQRAMKDGSAIALKHAPKNFAKYPSYDVTPKGEVGVGWKCYSIKGHLMLATTPTAANPKTTWHDCGSLPVF